MFTIPNEADAAFADQAEPDKVDLDILVAAHKGDGVIAGCAVTAQVTPDMTVAVASGSVIVGGTIATVSSGNVTITAANPTNPRFDLVVVSNAGVKSAAAGTAAANPVFPAIPASSVVLAAVYVPAADTDIDSNQIVDKRVIVIEAVLKALFDANTFIYATTDNTPEAKTRAEVMALLSGQAAADFAMNAKKITGLANATAADDAASQDLNIVPAEGFVRKLSATGYYAIKSNLVASVPPTIDDDYNAGYRAGSLWMTSLGYWVCQDPTAGAAYWLSLFNSLDTAELWDALGDLAYGTGPDTGARLAPNTTTTKKFLTQTGNGAASAAPVWEDHGGAADPHTGYQKESEKDAASGYAGLSVGSKIAASQMQEVLAYADLTDDPVGTHAALTAAHGATGAVVGTTNSQTLSDKTLTTPTIASFVNATHAHAAAASGGALYSVHQYVFTPDAAPATAIVAGDQQGFIHVSGPSDEIVKRIVSHCETAPVTTAATWQIEYALTATDNEYEDLDKILTWQEIDPFSHTAAHKTVVSTSFTTAALPARRAIRFNVDAIGGTAAQDVTVIMEIWRPLQA